MRHDFLKAWRYTSNYRTGIRRFAPRVPPMMSLPFFGLFFALLLAFAGQRLAAVLAWLISMAVLLALFHAHATDPLNIVL